MKSKGLIKKMFISIIGFVKRGIKFWLESNNVENWEWMEIYNSFS